MTALPVAFRAAVICWTRKDENSLYRSGFKVHITAPPLYSLTALLIKPFCPSRCTDKGAFAGIVSLTLNN